VEIADYIHLETVQSDVMRLFGVGPVPRINTTDKARGHDPYKYGDNAKRVAKWYEEDLCGSN